MDIQNFTDNTIRLGEFPYCVDVSNIQGYHSSNGIHVRLFNDISYSNGQRKSFFQIRRDKSNPTSFHLFVFRYDDQTDELDELDEYSEIVFDSRCVKDA